jgi:hypothetical protein
MRKREPLQDFGDVGRACRRRGIPFPTRRGSAVAISARQPISAAAVPLSTTRIYVRFLPIPMRGGSPSTRTGLRLARHVLCFKRNLQIVVLGVVQLRVFHPFDGLIS